ncbi:tRNA 2-thiocytidine(32) synthetase TtcA, partial [Rhizobium ruizarguesonis]
MNIAANIAEDLETGEADTSGHALFADAPRSVSFKKLRKRLLRQVRQAFDDFDMLKGQKR